MVIDQSAIDAIKDWIDAAGGLVAALPGNATPAVLEAIVALREKNQALVDAFAATPLGGLTAGPLRLVSDE